MKTCIFILLIVVNSITYAQTLTIEQREKCKNDIKFNFEMAQQGYGEAEFILAQKFHKSDPYDDTYKDYWGIYDSKNPFVAASYWFKKACEHNWIPAYSIYSHYCFYERGNTKGGVEESLKWIEKALEKDSLNWDLKANEAICTWIINEDSFYTDKDFFYPNLINVSHKMSGAKSEFIEKYALICYHSINNKKTYPNYAFYFFKCAYNTSMSSNNPSIKALFYLYDCFHKGYGTEKNEKKADIIIMMIINNLNIEVDWSNQNSVNNVLFFIFDEINNQISKDKEEFSHYKSFKDIFFLY